MMHDSATLAEAVPEEQLEAPPEADALAVEIDLSQQVITELERAEERVLRETDAGVTVEARRHLIEIRADRELHERRHVYLARRLIEVRHDDLLADVEGLNGELAERQREAIARAEAALRPAVWTRLTKGLDGVVEGLEVLQEAHRARQDREVLRQKFDLWSEDPEIVPVPPLELAVRERLKALERRITDLYGACDRTVAVGSGRVPHQPSTAVSELLQRHEELQETK